MYGVLISLAVISQVSNTNYQPNKDSARYYTTYYKDLPIQDARYLDSFIFTKYVNYAEVRTINQRFEVRKSFRNMRPSLIPRTVAELRAAGLMK